MALPDRAPRQPELQSDRLRLRCFRLSDAPAMYEYSSDPEITRFLSWETHHDEQQALNYIQQVQLEFERGEWPGWGIELTDERKLVGAISLRNWHPAHYQTELSYVMNRAYAGRGIMTEAVGCVLELCFKALRLERVEARCMTDNAGSEKVMQKVGMSFEGVLRHHQWIKGKFHDFKIYSILRDEYFRHITGAQ